ncbi:MAG: hypothetical protein K0R54_1945 [Clostridiaceae bacterium]|jgi:hypothetical protein|nr:hypothetical protein [Clostridiaceae bacterium]
MRENVNSILFFVFIIITSLLSGCQSKIENIDNPQIKNFSKVTAVEYKSTNEDNIDSFVPCIADTVDKEEIRSEVERIFNQRSACLVSGDTGPLNELFDTSQKYGKWALEHEIKRVKYLNQWSDQRDITFGKIESSVRINKIYPKGKVMKIALQESYKFEYTYNGDENSTVNCFGVGIRHTASLTKKNDKWVIYNDWYTDCFEDALHNFTISIPNLPLPIHSILDRSHEASYLRRPFYDRQKAVAYADKYCGAAWGSGNNFKYNKKYSDYNGAGGDCTNFISQVLGDKEEGGGMPIGGGWTSGSHAWSNADGLKNFLIYSGRGSVISVGTYKDLTKPTEALPNGAVGKLKLGDLVAYEKGRGNIDHFAVITGFDSHGYPLVNSHTTDRYHVPWDLGWGDSKIRFFLIHING